MAATASLQQMGIPVCYSRPGFLFLFQITAILNAFFYLYMHSSITNPCLSLSLVSYPSPFFFSEAASGFVALGVIRYEMAPTLSSLEMSLVSRGFNLE